MNFRRTITLVFLAAFLGLILMSFKVKKGEEGTWEVLLDKTLSNWDVFIGVPHHTLDLKGYEKGDGMNGTPIGLNKDPLNIFSMIEMDGEEVLKVTGVIYGGISTKKVYENYHLSLKFKWGEKKYEPRLNDKRDSGILYHCQDPHGKFWNVWMKSPEMQIQEGDCGDFHPLAGVGMDIKVSTKIENDEEFLDYDPKGEVKHFKSGPNGRCRRMANFEKPNDQWNQLELICIADKAYHIVNGKVVMVLENSVSYDDEGNTTTLNKGKIQLQSEGAELYYKDIKIKRVTTLPKAIAKQVK